MIEFGSMLRMNISEREALAHANGGHYSTREFTRARSTRKNELEKARQYLLSFLLRLGKSFDGFSVMGPYIRSADMFRENPSLDIESRVNGETRQKSNTRLLRMKFSDLIYELSRCMTLEPGDTISTGTPSGVGMGFDPPRYLSSGDEIECIVEGLGVLRNTVK